MAVPIKPNIGTKTNFSAKPSVPSSKKENADEFNLLVNSVRNNYERLILDWTTDVPANATLEIGQYIFFTDDVIYRIITSYNVGPVLTWVPGNAEVVVESISAVWGSIAGDITDQTDLVNYINAQIAATVETTNYKDNVRCATTANITLSGLQTIDSVSALADSRVLVKSQTNPAENGIYLMKSGAWVRSDDADSGQSLQSAVVIVDLGSSNADTSWLQISDNVVLSVTGIIWIAYAVAVPDATETVKGKAELATQAEVEAAVTTALEASVDDLRIVVPRKLRQWWSKVYEQNALTISGSTLTIPLVNRKQYIASYTATANHTIDLTDASLLTVLHIHVMLSNTVVISFRINGAVANFVSAFDEIPSIGSWDSTNNQLTIVAVTSQLFEISITRSTHSAVDYYKIKLSGPAV